MGKSKPWPYALEKMTGSKEMSAAPIKDYFQPLQKWLVKERCSKRYKIGWPGQPADGVEPCPAPTRKGPTSGQILRSGMLWSVVTFNIISLLM